MDNESKFDILTQVVRTVESTLKLRVGQLDIDAEFESFGIDSIIGMELMAKLSSRLNISLTPAQFINVDTVRELAAYIEANFTVDLSDVSPVNKSSKIEMANETLSENITDKMIEKQPNDEFAQLIGFIQKKYSIDLSLYDFSSVDEIAGYLVANNLSEMLNHYGLKTKSTRKDNVRNRETTTSQNVRSNEQTGNMDIAIVGMSCRFPDASSPQKFWENLSSQKNSIDVIPESRWKWQDYYADTIQPGKTVSKWGALIEDVDCFDPVFFDIERDYAKLIDPQERILMQEVYNSFQDAGINVKEMAGTSTGVFVGYEYSDYEQFFRQNVDKIENVSGLSSASPTYYLANRLSYVFDFCGPSESININCASSAVAINRAYYSLVNRESDLAVASGVSLNLFANDYIVLSQQGLFSSDGSCAVFDNNANGYTRGEGVGVILLKRLDDAKRDRDRVYSVIKSSHQNNRGNAKTISDIKHESITSVISQTYSNASITPESVNYIEVNGYATKWGDSFEFEGIKNVFSDIKTNKKQCALGSLKGNIGHLEPVNGIAAVIKIALSMKNKQFPATISKNKLNEFIDIKSHSHPLYIAESNIAFDTIRDKINSPIRAGINSFSDSGANVHLLLEEYQSEIVENNFSVTGENQLFILSARNFAQLEEYVKNYIDFLSKDKSQPSFEKLIYTLQCGRESMSERLAITADSNQDLLAKLKFFNAEISQGKEVLEAQGIFYGNSEKTEKNSLGQLITEQMIAQLVEQNIATKQWQGVALLWINGANIFWKKVWLNIDVEPVSLPGYPFAKEQYWLTGEQKIPVDEPCDDNSLTGKNRKTQDINRAKSVSYVGPRNETESKLVEIWAQALNLDPESIGINDNFFDLGGHSLLATQLVSKIRGELGIDLPLIAFLDVSTLAGTAEVINSIKYQYEETIQVEESVDIEFEEGAI